MIDPSSIPNDSTVDALRRVLRDGSDLSLPMEIDFHVRAPSEHAGQAIARIAADMGYQTKVVRDSAPNRFTVWCTRRMIASHEAISAVERQLDEAARPFGGYIDGWGTFGNVEAS